MEGVAYTGIPSKEELASCPGVPSEDRMRKGRVAVIECVQRIPCNPCVIACPFGAIRITGDITELPELDGAKCTGCGTCVPQCPGLAIFLVDTAYSETEAAVDFPFEYLPLPAKGVVVEAVDRAGKPVCSGTVVDVRNPADYDGAAVIRLVIPKEYAGEVRSMKRLEGH